MSKLDDAVYEAESAERQRRSKSLTDRRLRQVGSRLQRAARIKDGAGFKEHFCQWLMLQCAKHAADGQVSMAQSLGADVARWEAKVGQQTGTEAVPRQAQLLLKKLATEKAKTG